MPDWMDEAKNAADERLLASAGLYADLYTLQASACDSGPITASRE